MTHPSKQEEAIAKAKAPVEFNVRLNVAVKDERQGKRVWQIT